MKLREAILKGAERVDRRGRGRFVKWVFNDGVEACALGAAYLGCHPEVDPRIEDPSLETRIDEWVMRLHLTKPELCATSYELPLITINDRSVTAPGWDHLITEVERRRPGLLDVEVCDEPDQGDCA